VRNIMLLSIRPPRALTTHCLPCHRTYTRCLAGPLRQRTGGCSHSTEGSETSLLSAQNNSQFLRFPNQEGKLEWLESKICVAPVLESGVTVRMDYSRRQFGYGAACREYLERTRASLDNGLHCANGREIHWVRLQHVKIESRTRFRLDGIHAKNNAMFW
jgi:hypothetical protein